MVFTDHLPAPHCPVRTTTHFPASFSFLTRMPAHPFSRLGICVIFSFNAELMQTIFSCSGKPIVAGNNLDQQIAVKTTDVAQVHSQLKGQRIAVWSASAPAHHYTSCHHFLMISHKESQIIVLSSRSVEAEEADAAELTQQRLTQQK